MDTLEFRVLGPVTVLRDGVPVDLGGSQRSAVLTMLLLHANRVVDAGVLADMLWGEAPPRSHRVQLQGLVSDLRRRLAGTRSRRFAPIETRPPGYRLRVPDDRLDLALFRNEVARARAADDAGTTVDVLEPALARWRGPAYGGFAYVPALPAVSAVDEERWTALEDLIDARLVDGRLAGLSAELVRLTGEHPYRERFHQQLMTVLARGARVGEALSVYRDLRERLANDLGVEPSAEVQHVHREILRTSSGPLPPTAADPDQLSPVHVHRQLPADLADFTGRTAELAAVLAIGRADDADASARVVAVSGMAGIGKTRMALRAGHRLVAEGRYRDGQVYADLGGVAESGPAGAGATLEHVLRLLGIPQNLIPATTPARSAVLRDHLAGRSILLILDNAVDEQQVEPLLAVGPAGLVIVCSRRALALDGARHVHLSPFTTDEAVRLVATVAGADRVAAEPAAAAALVTFCDHLPLAVTVAAHRLRMRPTWPVSQMVERVAAQGRRLDELAAGGRTVEAVFRHAYESLDARLRHVFRRAGLHPGADFTAASMAALAEIDPAEADTALEALLDQHLVLQPVPGRYRMHDLLRAFARRTCGREEPDGGARAVRHLLDWYVGAVTVVSRPLRRFRVGVPIRVPEPKAPVPHADGIDEAMSWIDAEVTNLLAVIRLADEERHHDHLVALVHLLRQYFVRRTRLAERLAANRLAEAAARDAGDVAVLAHTMAEVGEAYVTSGHVDVGEQRLRRAVRLHELAGDDHGRATALNYLGTAQRRLGRYDDAAELFRTALSIFREHGDNVRVASTESNLAVVLHLAGRNEAAVDHARSALRAQSTVDGPGEAPLRTNLARIYGRLGRYQEAVDEAHRALPLHRRDGSLPGEAITLAVLSFGVARLGRYGDAVRMGRSAVEIARRIENPEIEAHALNTLAEAYGLAGRDEAAVRLHQRALAIVRRTGDEDERVRAETGLADARRRADRRAAGTDRVDGSS